MQNPRLPRDKVKGSDQRRDIGAGIGWQLQAIGPERRLDLWHVTAVAPRSVLDLATWQSFMVSFNDASIVAGQSGASADTARGRRVGLLRCNRLCSGRNSDGAVVKSLVCEDDACGGV